MWTASGSGRHEAGDRERGADPDRPLIAMPPMTWTPSAMTCHPTCSASSRAPSPVDQIGTADVTMEATVGAPAADDGEVEYMGEPGARYSEDKQGGYRLRCGSDGRRGDERRHEAQLHSGEGVAVVPGLLAAMLDPGPCTGSPPTDSPT